MRRLAICILACLTVSACQRSAASAAAAPPAPPPPTQEPPSAVPEELARATVQLRARYGDGYRIIDNVIAGQAVCGHVDPEGASRSGGPQATATFVSTPTALSLSGETPDFAALLRRTCPELGPRP